METVVLTVENPPTTTKSGQSGLLKLFGQIILRLLTFWIPRASPDYEANLSHVKYWYIEVDKNTGTPQREIGFDITNRAILFAPTNTNYGLWTDSPATFTWTDYTTVDLGVFNDIFEALEKHDFKIVDEKINKYLKLWTENSSIKTPEFPILICNLDSMSDILYCKTIEQVYNVDVSGYEWEGKIFIDRTGNVYSTNYINFGHPVGCVVPAKIERHLGISQFKEKSADMFIKFQKQIYASKDFEDLFEVLNRVA